MRLFVLCNLLVVLLAAGQLQAAIIFNTFGPGDSYGTSSWTIGYSGDEFDIGGKFAITVGIPHTLDSIELAVGMYGGTKEIDVWLMSDAASEPGAIIEAFNFKNFPEDGSILVGNSVLNPILTPGTNYWLIASAPHEDDTYAGWKISNPVVFIGILLGGGSWGLVSWAIASAASDSMADLEE